MLLHRRQFFVKERVAVVKLTDTYEILDPESRVSIGIARDQLATWAKWLRLLVNKALLPTTVNVYEQESAPPVLSLKKRHAILRTTVLVHDARGQLLGRFRSKLFTIGGGFDIFGPNDESIGELKGDWKGWNFRLLDTNGGELGVVTKKWAGLGRELFTSADQYMIALGESVPMNETRIGLLLAAGLAIDIVFKEKQ